MTQLGLEMERESGDGSVCWGKGEIGRKDKRGVVWRAKKAKAGFKGERERRGYSSGGRKIGELERRTRGKVGGE